MAPPDGTGVDTMMAASLWSTAVAAGRTTLLSLGFAGLGAVIAPADWPPTMSAYSLHEMPPSMGYASWGVVVALHLQTVQRFVQSVRVRRLDWTLPASAFCLLVALAVAEYGTFPYCICDDLSGLVLPSVPVTFDDETPGPPGSATDVPAGRQDGFSR